MRGPSRRSPRVLLFDEPLSNLDAQLRDEMQIELKRLQRGLGITTLFVTHDQGEALSMSDRVGVMAKGVMQQFATPEEIYHRPATGFVASFIGKPNRLPGTVAARDGEGGSVRLGDGLELPAAFVDQPVGAMVDVVIRQEAIRLRNGTARTWRACGHRRAALLQRRARAICREARGGVELVAETASSGPNAALAPRHAGLAGDRCRLGLRHGADGARRMMPRAARPDADRAAGAGACRLLPRRRC